MSFEIFWWSNLVNGPLCLWSGLFGILRAEFRQKAEFSLKRTKKASAVTVILRKETAKTQFFVCHVIEEVTDSITSCSYMCLYNKSGTQ